MLIEKPILTVEETSYFLGISCQMVYQLIRSGKLEAYKDEGYRRWRIIADSVLRYQEKMLLAFKQSITMNRKL